MINVDKKKVEIKKQLSDLAIDFCLWAADCDDNQAITDLIREFVDNNVDTDHYALKSWLCEDESHVELLEEATDEFGWESLYANIQCAQYLQMSNELYAYYGSIVLNLVLNALADHVEEIDEQVYRSLCEQARDCEYISELVEEVICNEEE